MVITVRDTANTWTATVARLAPVVAVQRSATSFWTTSDASWSWWLVEQLADQLARQVVGDVAGDQLAAVGKGPRNVEAENVGLHGLDVFVAGHNFMQRGHQARVELNRNHPSAARCQRDGQSAGAGADFEHLILRLHACRLRDGVAQLVVDEEVLAEAVLEGDPVATQKAVELMRVRRVDHFIFWKRVVAFVRSWSASCSRLTPRKSATSSAVSMRYAGRLGTFIRFCELP